ncbi:MAG: cation diffusion facilitator family transporter [Candidatus Caldatribacteriaceae bacterium]
MLVYFNAWFLEKFFPGGRYSRKGIAYLEVLVSIVGNVLLFLVKFLLGLSLHSVALMAEAFHSLSDVLTSLVVFLGFRWGDKPADREHPFGHGRIEQITTLVIALILFLVVYDLGSNSVQRILRPIPVESNSWVVIFMVASGLFKEWMARFSVFLGKKIDSQALIADAWHHRSDAIASMLVGFGLFMVRFGVYSLDGILGLLVVVFIAWVGIELLQESISFLIGKAPNKEFMEKLRTVILSVPGVLSFHDVLVHDYQSQKVISLHIKVQEDLTAREAHQIALEVQDRVREKLGNSKISVHIDPRGERED